MRRGARDIIVPGSGNGGGLTNVKISAGTLSQHRSDITFSNANGVSFGLETNGIVTATVQTNYLTSQSNQNVTAANGGFAFQTLSFSDVNGISFGTSAGSAITASHNALTSQSNQALSGSNGSFTFQTATFGNSNGLTFYTTNGSMVGSYTVPTQSDQTLGLYGVGNTTQNSSTTLDARTVSFGGRGIVTVGFSNGTVQISATEVPQTNQTLGLYAVGNTTGQSSSSTFDARTVSFVGQGIASVGFSNGSVNISVPSGGGGLTNINISAGTTSNNLSNFVLSDSNGVSFGLNGSTITASVAAGGAPTVKSYNNLAGLGGDTGWASFTADNLVVIPLGWGIFPGNMSVNSVLLRVSTSLTATGSSSSNSFTFQMGLYTLNGSTLSLATSGSSTFAVAAGTSNTALSHGPRFLTMHSSLFDAQPQLTQGHYWFCFMVRTSNFSLRAQYAYEAAHNLGTQASGTLGVSSETNTSAFGHGYFHGVYATTTTAMPTSIGTDQLNRGTVGPFAPFICFLASDMKGVF